MLAGSLLAAAPAQAATADVAMGDFFYRAKQVRIDPGDSVTWTNRGDVLHNVTSRRGAPQAFRSANLDPVQAFSRVFSKAGTYDYLCSIHPDQMRGTVQVGPDRTKPKFTSVRARSGKRTSVGYRLSEKARVVVKLVRRGRTVRTLRPKGAARGFVTQYLKRPAEGRYRVVVTATDEAGNKATARVSLTVD